MWNSRPTTTNEKLALNLRRSVEGRGRFDDFDRADFGRAADVFCEAGYYRIETIRKMQAHAVTIYLANLRRNRSKTSTIKSARLAHDLIEAFQTKMENAKAPESKKFKSRARLVNGPLLTLTWPEYSYLAKTW